MCDELINAFRYCISDEYVKRGCCKCPINKDGMICGTQDDAIKYAADAIEELQKDHKFCSDMLKLALRVTGLSMSALVQIYQIEQNEKREKDENE